MEIERAGIYIVTNSDKWWSSRKERTFSPVKNDSPYLKRVLGGVDLRTSPNKKGETMTVYIDEPEGALVRDVTIVAESEGEILRTCPGVNPENHGIEPIVIGPNQYVEVKPMGYFAPAPGEEYVEIFPPTKE